VVGVPWRVFAVAALLMSSLALGLASSSATGGGPSPMSPPVTLISPVGGEDWTGGSTHSIVWDQSSPSGADIAWALDWLDYSTWVQIANGTAGNGPQTYTWRVPSVDRTNAQVRVCAGARTG